MGADSPQRQRRHAKKLERLRRREADRRKASGTGAAPPGRTVEGDVQGPSSGVRQDKKLSEVLLDLAAPFLPGEERNLEEMRDAIALAATVWNTVVLDQQGEREWEHLVASIGKRAGEGAPKLLQIAEAMRDRKLDRYASDLRTALRWTVTEREDTFNVQVLSALPGREKLTAKAREAEAPPSAPWQRPLTRPP